VAFPPDFVNQACSASGGVVVDEMHGQSPSPFKVVLVGVSANGSVAGAVSARVYSSETGVWGDLVSTAERGRVGSLPSTLVGSDLYWWLAKPCGSMLRFDLSDHTLAVIDRPKNVPGINVGCSRIIRREDGGVGLAVLSSPTLCFYDRRVDPHGVVTWPLRRIVQIDDMLGLLAVVLERGTFIAGYTEEADTILLKVNCGDRDYEMHMLHLHSMEHRKLQGEFMGNAYYPFASFYLGGKHFLLCLHLCGIFFR
jgi:hypothetical protein